MKYLFVVAHPDDEVLGAGGTIRKLVDQGHKVAVCTMCNNAEARANASKTLGKDQEKAFTILGVKKAYSGDFPNIMMNTVPHLDLVRFIESCIEDWGAECVFTHHPSDVNVDHVVTSGAVQAAIRLFQRKAGVKPIKQVAYMEVLSSTEWSLDSSSSKFNPNTFVEIGKSGLETKLKALKAYKGVMRVYPHPRSKEAISALATNRGAQSGLYYAEAFETVFSRIE